MDAARVLDFQVNPITSDEAWNEATADMDLDNSKVRSRTLFVDLQRSL